MLMSSVNAGGGCGLVGLVGGLSVSCGVQIISRKFCVSSSLLRLCLQRMNE